MKRVTFGSASCAFFALASVALSFLGFCRLMIAITPPGGSGEFQGLDHIGWLLGILYTLGLIPLLGVIGLCLGLIGGFRARADRSLAWWGASLNGFIVVLSPFVWHLMGWSLENKR